MSSTIDSKPDLQRSQNGHTKPRFTLGQLFPASVRETFVGPNKAGWATTGLYMAGAALCLGVTAGFAWLNQPAEIAEFGKVGQPFFAEFVDPTLATSLKVSTFDTKNVEPREFEVAQSKNGQWVIPSHHDYPADAEEQLAGTAASVIGVERGAMVTRWPADHAKYGVVDPQQDTLSVDQVDGVGQRLTLRGENDAVLADFIVGKQVEGEFGQYYVRHPEEDEVYITNLDVDLSTKFTDWIDTDLFDLNTSDVRRVTINDYSFDEFNGSLTQSEVSELTRDDSSNDWKLASSISDNEELNKDSIRDTLNEIAGLEITGVRPKQEGLTPDLKLDRNALKSQAGVERLQADLLSSGFLLQPSEEGDQDQLKLIAREGELMAGTKDGLVYRLHFGRAFAGSQEELEVGFVSTDVSESSEADQDATGETKSDDASDSISDEDNGDSNEGDTGKPGRYVFVRVDFDEELLGEKPNKPVAPIKPERLTELEELAEAESDASPDKGKKPQLNKEVEGQPSGSPEDSEDPSINSESKSVDIENAAEVSTESGDEKPQSDSTEAEKTSVQTELEQLQSEFEAAQSKYETDLKSFEDYQSRLKSGLQKSKELNRRFAKWYYVISGESYDALALTRDSFVLKKEIETETPESQDSATESDATVDSSKADKKVDSVSTLDEHANESDQQANSNPSNQAGEDPTSELNKEEPQEEAEQQQLSKKSTSHEN